jgi:hypothetical protein
MGTLRAVEIAEGCSRGDVLLFSDQLSVLTARPLCSARARIDKSRSAHATGRWPTLTLGAVTASLLLSQARRLAESVQV